MSFLFVALDSPNRVEVEGWVKLLDGVEGNFGYKINLDYIVRNGAAALKLHTDRPVFADVKMWNGARTMISACRELAANGVAFTSVYALAGDKALKNLAVEVRESAPTLKLLGLTVLTHYDDEYCQTFFSKSLLNQVALLVETIKGAGLDGVIVPGSCLAWSKLQVLNKLVLVPAVRPANYIEKRDDQLQTTLASFAAQNGANLLVCGSPITKSNDSVTALTKVLQEI